MKLNLRSIIWTGFLGRVLLNFYSFSWGMWGVESDLMRLHGIGQIILKGLSEFHPSDLGLWGMFYSYYLSYVYFLTTDSVIIANILACLAWLFSAFILLRIMNMFSLNYRDMLIVVILYSVLPSSLIYTSSGLREAYMLLFVNMSIYSALIFYYHRDVRALLLLILAAGLLSLLHITFIVYALFIIGITLLVIALRNLNVRMVQALPYFLLGSIALIFIGVDVLQSMGGGRFRDGVMNAILNFQEGSVLTGIDSRATYKFFVPEEGGFLTSIAYLVSGFFQYLFEPLPWRIGNFRDLVLTLENILRGIMIFLGIKALFSIHEDNKKVLCLFLLSFLVLEFTWSIGTTNWGTASRHHVPSLGLMLILGFAFKGSLQKSKNLST